jgi:hypothetical protein
MDVSSKQMRLEKDGKSTWMFPGLLVLRLFYAPSSLRTSGKSKAASRRRFHLWSGLNSPAVAFARQPHPLFTSEDGKQTQCTPPGALSLFHIV